MSVWATAFDALIGTANATPALSCVSPSLRIWSAIPITVFVAASMTGPPELPWLIAASVWIAPEVVKLFGDDVDDGRCVGRVDLREGVAGGRSGRGLLRRDDRRRLRSGARVRRQIVRRETGADADGEGNCDSEVDARTGIHLIRFSLTLFAG